MAEVYTVFLIIPLSVFSHLLIGVAVVRVVAFLIWFLLEVILAKLFAGNIDVWPSCF